MKMNKFLHVYLYGRLAGKLEQNQYGRLVFQYEETWLHQSKAIALSQSLPLQAGVFQEDQCRPFFEGVLPEGRIREVIAKVVGVSAQNNFSLLEKIGEECAGAVSLVPEAESMPKPIKHGTTEYLSEDELHRKLLELPKRPLLAGEHGMRISLAGAQNKLPVIYQDSRVYLPLYHIPSTHIIKLPAPEFADMVQNEYFCMRLAEEMDLDVAQVELKQVKDVLYLIVLRYDREFSQEKEIKRIHQEDFCQALGILTKNKYQAEGGPSIAQCLDVIKKNCFSPALDLQKMLKAVMFNYLIGNQDSHGKNISLLMSEDGWVGFAPLYDLLSTSVYPELTSNMAMKIGGKYDPDKVFKRHWEQTASAAGLNPILVIRLLKTMAETISARAEVLKTTLAQQNLQSDVYDKIIQVIHKRVKQVLKYR